MTVKDIKKITSTSTSILVHIAKDKESALDEKSCWSPHLTYAGSREHYYDNLEVVYIHPYDEAKLDVWVIANN